MFYQIEVDRLAHVATSSYGDTVALIKDKEAAIDFARDYSERSTTQVVHVHGTHCDKYFRNGIECTRRGCTG